MKFTITRINKQNKLTVSTKTVDSFLERIAKDDAKQSVARFRMSVPLLEGDYQYYKGNTFILPQSSARTKAAISSFSNRTDW